MEIYKFFSNYCPLAVPLPKNKTGTKQKYKRRQKQQGKLHRQRKRAPPTFGNKGYTISVNFKRAHPLPGICHLVGPDGGEFIRKPLPGGGAFVSSSRSG